MRLLNQLVRLKTQASNLPLEGVGKNTSLAGGYLFVFRIKFANTRKGYGKITNSINVKIFLNNCDNIFMYNCSVVFICYFG